MTIGYTARALVYALILAVLMSAGVACDAFLAFGDGVAIVPALLLVILVPAAAVVVPMSVRAVWRALLRRSLLTIDDEAVTLHSARVSLPWRSVAEIRIARTLRRGRQVDLLVFVPADLDQGPATPRGLARWFARDATRRFGGPIYLRVKDLTHPLDDVLAAARQRTPAPVTRRTVLNENLPRQI